MLNAFNKTRVGTKVAWAMGLVIVMHATTVIVSHFGLAQSQTRLNQYHELNSKTIAILENVVMAGEAVEFAQLSNEINPRKLKEFEATSQEISTALSRYEILSDVVGIFTIIIGALAGWWLRREIVPPLNAITQTLLRLTRGERDLVVPGLNRNDEIGHIAAAAEVFRLKSDQTQDLLQTSQELQRDLEISELRFRNAFDNAPIGIALVGIDGKWLAANQPLCKMLGYTEDELLNLGFQNITHTEDLDPDTEDVNRLLAGDIHSYTRSKRYIHHTGRIVWTELAVSLVREDDGSPAYFVSQVQDLTEHKKTQSILTQYRYGIDRSGIVAITDAQGTIVHINDKFCQISGYSRDELIGKNHRILNSNVHPRSFFEDMYKTLEKEGVWHDNICNRAKDGSYYWVDTTIVAFRDMNGKISQYLAIRYDITEHKQALEHIQQANDDLSEKTAEMEQFTYTVSHDLKSPLVSCMGLIDCAREDLDDDDPEAVCDSLDRIGRNIGRMERCINDLLELSRVGLVRHEPEWIDLHDTIDQIISGMGIRFKEKDATFSIETQLPDIYADATRIGELYDNLISNAIKYACIEPGTRITVGAETIDGQQRLYVRDTGPGIDPRYHEKIFGLFQRLARDDEGTGIGLAIVSRIMKIHEGRAWVESGLGVGTTFWLAFPKDRMAPHKSKHRAA